MRDHRFRAPQHSNASGKPGQHHNDDNVTGQLALRIPKAPGTGTATTLAPL